MAVPNGDPSSTGGRGLVATLYGGSFAFLVIHVAGAALSFALHATFVRVAGAEQYGHYAYASNWFAILLLLCHLGLNTSSLRFVASYSARHEWQRLRGFISFSRGVVVVASLLVGSGVWAWTSLASGGIDSDLAAALKQLSWGFPVVALLTLWGAQLRALHKILASQGPLSLLFPVAAGVGVIAAAIAGVDVNARNLAFIHVLAMTLAAVVSGGLLLRSTRSDLRGAGLTYETLHWAKVTAPMLAIAFLHIIQLRTSITILGLVAPPEDVARFTIATRLATLTSFAFVAASAWASPLIARYDSLGDGNSLARIARLSARATFAFASLIVGALVTLGKEALQLFDPSFSDAHSVLVVLAGGELVMCFTGPALSLLIMTGHQGAATRVEVLVAMTAAFSSLLLVPTYGAMGAAVAALLASLVRNAGLAVAVWLRLGIRCGPF